MILGECTIDPSATVCEGAVIGKPFRPLLNGQQDVPGGSVIRLQAYVGYYAIVGARSIVGRSTVIDDHCIVESDVELGAKTLLIYRAQVCNEATIGENCVVGGLIGERTSVASDCRVFGKVVHLQHDPTVPWDSEEVVEGAPTIGAHAFIGFGAIVAGPVSIGERAYISAGAVVTRDVPSRHIAYGTNKVVPFTQWNGRLASSPLFQGS